MKMDPGEFNRWRLLFMMTTVLTVSALFAFPDLWSIFIGPFHFVSPENLYPFLDMHGRLAAFDAHRAGIDILYNPNPYDPMHRVNIKPTWPLHLTFLGLGREHLLIAGFATVGTFLAIIMAIIRPKHWYESLLMILLCLSPPIFLGIERANDDLVYLILLASIPLLLGLKSSMKYWLTWLVIFMLAPAKYYPGAVFLVFLSEVKNWKLLGLLLSAGAVFLLAYFLTHTEEILYLRHAVPKPTRHMIHGAEITFTSMDLPAVFGKLYSLGLMALGTWIIFRKNWPRLELSPNLQYWFLIGYSVAFFCFALNSNFDYRFVYTLLMLPLLLHLLQQRQTFGGWAVSANIMMLLLVPVFWLDTIYLNARFLATGAVTGDILGTMTPIKNLIFCAFMIGSTTIAATLIRPNVRHLFNSFLQDLRPSKLEIVHDS